MNTVDKIKEHVKKHKIIYIGVAVLIIAFSVVSGLTSGNIIEPVEFNE